MSDLGERRPLVGQPRRRPKLPYVGTLKVSGADTGGALEEIQLQMDAPIGSPPHVHKEHDEVFVILEGELRFALGNESVDAKPGSIVVVPSGWRHGFESVGRARALVVTIPAGLDGFFSELRAGMARGRSDQELRAELETKYDSHPY